MDPAIITVLTILIATVVALIFEAVRIDVVALVCMLALGWTGVLTPQETLSGFSSNAVIAMIAVMILGQGIAKTGIMDRFSRAVLEKVGTKKSSVIGAMSLSVGMLSGFIQNIGAAALFLPGILNISRRETIPASALIMPIGFAAIVGGTLSMVGSGPLILINDLLRSADLTPYGLFSVTPVGILLLLSGISFFFLFGKFVLPHSESPGESVSEQDKLIEALHLPHHIWHYAIPPGSALVGKTTEQSGVWGKFNLNILGISQGREAEYAPWREVKFEAGQEMALLGNEENVKNFASAYNLIHQEQAYQFSSLNDPERSGFAEVIIPPRKETKPIKIPEGRTLFPVRPWIGNDRRSHFAGIFHRRYRYGTDPGTHNTGSLSSHRVEDCFSSCRAYSAGSRHAEDRNRRFSGRESDVAGSGGTSDAYPFDRCGFIHPVFAVYVQCGRNCSVGPAGHEHGANWRTRSSSPGFDGSGMCGKFLYFAHPPGQCVPDVLRRLS